MQDFKNRQYLLIESTILQYRQGQLALNTLVSKLEALRGVLSESKVSDSLFEPILDLERINSEILVQKRTLNPVEAERISEILKAIEVLLSQQDRIDAH